MNLDHIQRIFFLGIGGIGMSAIARHFLRRGADVCGYDRTPSGLTRALEAEGTTITYADDTAGLQCRPDLVVYTPAVPETGKLFSHFKAAGTPMLKRAGMLRVISRQYPTIAIAGTHGKTTISTMLAHILKHAGIPCMAFLGGISTNYGTNYIDDPNPRWLIAEADEYDRSFLHLSPQIALISAIDSDHMDVYENRDAMLQSFTAFARRVRQGGVLITKDKINSQITYSGKQYNYRMDPPADYYLDNVSMTDARYQANIAGKLRVEGVRMQYPGRHNLENALAAAALAHEAGISAGQIRAGLNSFTGVKRRFEIVLQTRKSIFIDDYAHHPEEINACISSAREMWPDKKITGIFQPHLFSRTRDLADEFAESLSKLDELILLPVYPAREEAIEGVNTQMLREKVKLQKAECLEKEELVQYLHRTDTEVLITMGAGDIDALANPIKKLLMQKEQ
jgi:UDP-N-acetylmuramate--alanine ligase